MGRIVKVKDMKPGYTYCPVNETLEEYWQKQRIEYAKKCKPSWETDEDATRRAISECYELTRDRMWGIIPNTGILLRKPFEQPEWKRDIIPTFKLYFVGKGDEYAIAPVERGHSGIGSKRTGKKIWFHYSGLWVDFFLDLEDEIMEANPFPVYKMGPYEEITRLPDPEKWTTVSADTPYDPKGIDHVSVWDDSDMNILITLGIVSLFFLMAGPGGWAMLGTMWVLAAMGFHSKHEKKREFILKEREELGIRGDGLDDHIRW